MCPSLARFLYAGEIEEEHLLQRLRNGIVVSVFTEFFFRPRGRSHGSVLYKRRKQFFLRCEK